MEENYIKNGEKGLENASFEEKREQNYMKKGENALKMHLFES